MSDQKRNPFQFSLRTVLLLLLVIAAGLEFWLQERRLAKARRVLAAHGLTMEMADVKPGQVRATVTSCEENELYVLLTLLIEAREAGSMSILRREKVYDIRRRDKETDVVLTAPLEPIKDDLGISGEVRVIIDKTPRLDREGGTIIKRLFAAGPRRAMTQTGFVTTTPGDPDLTTLVKVHAAGSDVVEWGEPLPLINVDGEQYELVVE